MSGSLIWISGATEGIGLGLAHTVPFEDARIISLARRVHPEFPSVQFDLALPATYSAVQDSFSSEFAAFTGERAIFIQNAYHREDPAFVGNGDIEDNARALQANAVAPLILGEMFLRAVPADVEATLVLVSSAAARHPFPGLAGYCAAKAGIEMWVRTVRRELKLRGCDNRHVVAVRPGFVDTAGSRSGAEADHDEFPAGRSMAEQLRTRNGVLTPEEAGRDIWAGITPPPDESVLLFGEMVYGEPTTSGAAQRVG
jgi:benzil reductase ((S)-benzoin forming)